MRFLKKLKKSLGLKDKSEIKVEPITPPSRIEVIKQSYEKLRNEQSKLRNELGNIDTKFEKGEIRSDQRDMLVEISLIRIAQIMHEVNKLRLEATELGSPF